MHPSIKNSINKTRVLQEIRRKNGISRIEIAKLLNLDKSTISKLTSDLLEQNLIIDKKSEKETKHAGRKRINLQLNPSYGVIIGIDIQTEYYNVVVINLSGDLLLSYRELQPKGDFLSSLDTMLESTIEKCEKDYINILGIGLGIPGIVDPVNGIIIQSNPLRLSEPVNIYNHINKKYKYPVYLDNDANCCCWGDLTFSNGKDDENFLVALGEVRAQNREEQTIKTVVVGLGIVINGTVHTGRNFSAGEFKSLYWDSTDFSQFSITPDDFKLVPSDRLKTIEIIEELLQHLALFSNTFNFSKIVFAGFFNDYKVDITRILEENLAKNWGYPGKPDIDILFTTFGDYDVAYGSAGLVAERLFKLPDISATNDIKKLKGLDLFNYIANLKTSGSHVESSVK